MNFDERPHHRGTSKNAPSPEQHLAQFVGLMAVSNRQSHRPQNIE